MEALIGGITGLVVVALFIVARAHVYGASDGDWLNFAGVIFGVALTIATTKMVDWIINDAKERRRKKDFTSAMRSIAMGLVDMAEAEDDQLPDLSRATLSLWRVAGPLIDTLPDLDFDHRAEIGMVQMALDECLPNLANNAVLSATNPGLAGIVKVSAARLGQTVLPVTELFEKKPLPEKSRSS